MDKNYIKLSHKKWKAQLKKMKRKLKRQALAKSLENDTVENGESIGLEEEPHSIDEEEERQDHLKWLQREKEAQDLFKAKKEKEEKDRIQKEAEERLIKEQFEKEKTKCLEADAISKLKEIPEKKLEESSSICKDCVPIFDQKVEAWHNPELPAGLDPDAQDVCPFYKKVGTCRFGMRCSKLHPPPGLTSIIMIPGMFFCFWMRHEADVNLEYDDQDTIEEFYKFYDETYPEFQKAGTIKSYYVCCNYVHHLRGNVYVEYSSKAEAEKAFRMFNGRYFDKRQLSCQYVKVERWDWAICGLFQKKQGRCDRGKDCNFLHVFRCHTSLLNNDTTQYRFGSDRHYPNFSGRKRFRGSPARDSSRYSSNKRKLRTTHRSRSRQRSHSKERSSRRRTSDHRERSPSIERKRKKTSDKSKEYEEKRVVKKSKKSKKERRSHGSSRRVSYNNNETSESETRMITENA